MVLSQNVKVICDTVFSIWESEYDSMEEHFKLNLSKDCFQNKKFRELNNMTINDYLTELIRIKTGDISRYRYSTFKRRAEILLSNGKISDLVFDKVDKSTILNGLLKINPAKTKSVNDFFINDRFDFDVWSDYLLENNQILGVEYADKIILFSIFSYLKNIVEFYDKLPYKIEILNEDDCLLFYCIDENNIESMYFVSITNPLASHFL